ncbi:SDR family NAD(P)-dependent oxidoreductase [Piscinibacter gummiphilus]|uniref:NADP-dependent 3-hydroxy acid dehydrogenase YdfG n=1 Tax=Piscinibacter gummiphilus TaxID=946333 RepID=A0A1W6L604_9BURK|nr:SDR family oxidoreductase [Piscinibacter gummiphilus]ARN19761.1 SDR family oxidoreductase [Piscinibacter gummiphilus]ATU64434.1 NAD(P)-dependent oxidoreductase [Piscinibacter gummiphilus]GLS95168.1 oxidoreductase [Piscinibacter gummiphilus]
MSDSSKTAVITGASSGIGAVYAQRLAARGHDLILVARRLDRLEKLAHELSSAHGVRVETLAADLGTDSGVSGIEKVLASDKRIGMLVNNAGVARLAPLAGATAEDAMSQVSLNIAALTRLTRAVLPGFLARNQGTIVNVASVLAIQSLPISAVYSGTKAYVLAFTRALQAELASTGVKAQVLLPGVTATDLWSEGISGVPLSVLNQDSVMSTPDLVDAALRALDEGEAVTWPSVEDAQLWTDFEQARARLFAATQTGRPASRYRAG